MKLLTCFLLSLVVSPLLLAQDGRIDSTFGVTGIVETITGFAWGREVALQADGKIVVAGTIDNGGDNYDFAVARFNTNGSLDTTFGY